ncbi:MAG: efflux RND transporter periplasmic adaptor subunit [Parachlamydiaceae bacterium]|nr:efflux RND transporter periplasmic adaptor subunit [Parachlamydiaceae bacterium]
MIIENKKKFIFIFSFISLFLFFSSCEKKAPPQKIPPVPVSVLKIEPKTIPATFQYIGVIYSSHEVEIRARVTGYLEEIAYVEGSFVNKGDLLFQLDPRPFQATLAQMKALVANQKAVLWQATRAVSRYKPLYEQKAASQRDLDNAMAAEMSAEAEVLSAQAQVEAAEINLEYTTIRSPVSGLSSQAKYRVGSLISQEQQNLLTTISVVDPIWVEFSVSEQDVLKAQQLRKNGKMIFPDNNEFEVELVLADQTIFPEKGLVNFSAPTYSQQTGTLVVRAVLKNPGNELLPGQFVRVNLQGAIRPDAISIPQKAVVQSKAGTLVFVVKDGKAEMQPIEAGDWDGNNWIINSGLKAGDVVIVEGVNKVLPGTPVTIKEESPKEVKPSV